MKKETSKAYGFSLLELLVVIAIMGVLGGFVYPSINDWQKNNNSRLLTTQRNNLYEFIIIIFLSRNERAKVRIQRTLSILRIRLEFNELKGSKTLREVLGLLTLNYEQHVTP